MRTVIQLSLLLGLAGPATAQNLAGPATAQNLAGIWQGVEDPAARRSYPAVLRLQRGPDDNLFGILYQEITKKPGVTVTFQMEGRRTATGLRLRHADKLDETGWQPGSIWCEGSIALRYDAREEKLSGRATYRQQYDCDTGSFVFYRVKLKSAATVPARVASTLRVSGRDVRWYADPGHKQLLATGNAYPTRLSKTTTFYITQGYFPSAESQAVPITVSVTPPPAPALAKVKTKLKPGNQPATAARAVPRAGLAPRPSPLPAPDTARRRPPVAAAPAPTLPTGPAPLLLPTVLFRQSTSELLPSAYAALDALAAELQAQPTVRLRIVGHTDRLAQDDPAKNQALSEQRADAVRSYLVKAGIDAARLATAGYGDTRRLYPSPDVRNRRVEVERL